MNAHKALIEEQEDLELFQSVAEFNLYLVRYIHHSWLKTIKLSPLVKQLRKGGMRTIIYLIFYCMSFNWITSLITSSNR